MTFYPENEQVPEYLQTEEFVILPLTPTHVELDYAALMSNKEMLRLWSGSPWPSNDFTLAQNLADLEWHWSEHQERIAFTFTVLNHTEDRCLGCIYIKPMAEILAHNETWQALAEPVEAPAHNALIRFWTINNLDSTLFPILQQWFTTDWAFSKIYWHTPGNNQPQITLFQNNGLTSLGHIQMPGRGGSHHLFN